MEKKPQKTWSEMTRKEKKDAILGLVILAAFVVVGIHFCTKKSPEELKAIAAKEAAEAQQKKVDERQNEFDHLALWACEAAKDYVKTQLKSPGSAKFPSCGFSSDMKIRGNKEDMKGWIVEGYVDSQNGFGALLRTPFTVYLRVKKAGDVPEFEPIYVQLHEG